MKIALTGHTNGLGKYLYDNLDYQTIGFSRTNGYDINHPKQLLKDINDCDIFINNAYDKMAQVELLFQWFSLYGNKNKTIINIGSRAAEYVRHRNRLHNYSVYKSALLNASIQLNNSEREARICHLSPGYMKTDIHYNKMLHIIKFIIDNNDIEILNLIISFTR